MIIVNRVAVEYTTVIHSPANLTLTLRRHGGEHHNDGVIPWGSFNKFLKFTAVESENWPLHCHLAKLLNSLAKRWTLALKSIVNVAIIITKIDY